MNGTSVTDNDDATDSDTTTATIGQVPRKLQPNWAHIRFSASHFSLCPV